jgi:hypothetical protein
MVKDLQPAGPSAVTIYRCSQTVNASLPPPTFASTGSRVPLSAPASMGSVTGKRDAIGGVGRGTSPGAFLEERQGEQRKLHEQ